MDWLTFSVEMTKALAWPAAIAAIAWRFRKEIAAIVPRIRKAGPTGVEFDPGDQQAKIARSDPPAELKILPGLDRTPAMHAVEKVMHQQIALVRNEDQIDLLIRLLAQARLEVLHESTFHLIFASQISWLQQLEKGPATLADAELRFVLVQDLYPEAHEKRTLEAWLGFLKQRELMIEEEHKLQITDMGRDFLLFIAARHKGETRPF